MELTRGYIIGDETSDVIGGEGLRSFSTLEMVNYLNRKPPENFQEE